MILTTDIASNMGFTFIRRRLTAREPACGPTLVKGSKLTISYLTDVSISNKEIHFIYRELTVGPSFHVSVIFDSEIIVNRASKQSYKLCVPVIIVQYHPHVIDFELDFYDLYVFFSNVLDLLNDLHLGYH